MAGYMGVKWCWGLVIGVEDGVGGRLGLRGSEPRTREW